MFCGGGGRGSGVGDRGVGEVQSSILLEAAAHGVKVVYAPKNVFNFWPGRVANSLETYFDFRSDTVSMTDFRQKADAVTTCAFSRKQRPSIQQELEENLKQ